MVRTRFAPSPTGYLHIGGVRTALFNWLFARKHGGQFILRIDDTDQDRNIESALQPILDGFKWLGINWDEGPGPDGSSMVEPHGPYFQSEKNEKYQATVDQLLASGAAYRDYATPEELAAEREAAEKEKRDNLYSRRWMAETDEDAARFESEGRKASVRLKMPREGQCRFVDAVRGDAVFDWAREQDTFIQRADGSFIYHLASVVDDHDMEITHVIRAIEHFSNTPRQIFIAESLGYSLPTYAHIPFVAEPGSKTKLSKRKLDKYLKHRDFKKLTDHGLAIMEKMNVQPDMESFNPVLVDFYEAVGYQPDALVNYLLLLGWSLDDKTEFFSRDEMIEHFSLERVVKAPASFDPAKLIAFQDHYSQQQPVKRKVAACLPFLQRADLVDDPAPCEIGEYITKIVAASGDRIKVAGDILDFDDFFRDDQSFVYDEKAFEKRITKPTEAVDVLKKISLLLKETESFEAESLEKAIKAFVENEGLKIGIVVNALRVAVTGKGVGFGTFDTLAILGRERVLARIDRTLEKAANN